MTNWKVMGGASVGFAVAACFVTWVILGEGSPFYNYFSEHVALPNIIRQLLLIPYLALIISNPETEFGEMVVITVVEFVQWLIVGIFLTLLIALVLHGRHTDLRDRHK